MNDEHFMQLAIDACRRGIEQGQTPFGACIVRGSEIIVAAHNQVWANTDITAHAEVQAIRAACGRLHTVKLADCDIYSTTEPCPMCFSAIHWAGMRRIIFGASIADAAAAGFSELAISNEQMKDDGASAVAITPGILRDACRELFAQWSKRPDARRY